MKSSYNFRIRVTLMFSMIFIQTLHRVTWIMRVLGVWVVDFGVGRMDRVHVLMAVVEGQLNVSLIVYAKYLGMLFHVGTILNKMSRINGKKLTITTLSILNLKYS